MTQPLRPRFGAKLLTHIKPLPDAGQDRLKTSTDIAGKMLFNFPDRMLGQVLADLGDDVRLYIGMECAAQLGKSSRWSEL